VNILYILERNPDSNPSRSNFRSKLFIIFKELINMNIIKLLININILGLFMIAFQDFDAQFTEMDICIYKYPIHISEILKH